MENILILRSAVEHKRNDYYVKSLSAKNRFLREKNISNMKLCDSFIKELDKIKG